jgi:hypothetical protein
VSKTEGDETGRLGSHVLGSVCPYAGALKDCPRHACLPRASGEQGGEDAALAR